jgi:hypothetical protein
MKSSHMARYMRGFTLITALFFVTGCDTLREQLGAPEAPDEFSVIRRAPLERPTEVFENANELPVPVIGMARPQEIAPVKTAEQALLGKPTEEQTAVLNAQEANGQSVESASVAALLEKSGANQADPTIRDTIEAEHYRLLEKEQPTFNRLLGKVSKKEPSAKIVDAQGEFERLKKNSADGKAVTDGDTPTFDTQK